MGVVLYYPRRIHPTQKYFLGGLSSLIKKKIIKILEEKKNSKKK
jgi:hypothetical protein